MSESGRIIGIRHRRKQTAEGESRPTQVAIFDGKRTKTYDLASDDDELDFVRHLHPIAWRDVMETDDFAGVNVRHCKSRRLTKEENVADIPQNLIFHDKSGWQLITKVPTDYEGLQPGDTVVMIMGGSGKRLTMAATHPKHKVRVFQIPTGRLPKDRDKDEDAKNFIQLFQEQPGDFHMVRPKDRAILKLDWLLDLRLDAMKARIACEQRILQSLVGRTFCAEDGDYPDGDIELLYEEAKASDVIMASLLQAEKEREKELIAHVESMEIYRRVFKPIEGLGPLIAARIIALVGDIRRFRVEPSDREKMEENHKKGEEYKRQAGFIDVLSQAEVADNLSQYEMEIAVRDYLRAQGKNVAATLMDESIRLHRENGILGKKARDSSAAKFKAYCGVHLYADGTFPCRAEAAKRHEPANWRNDIRQGFYLLGDQFNRRPESDGGMRLRTNKTRYRERHPEPVPSGEKTKRGQDIMDWTDGHIHKSATWRTISQKAVEIYRAWDRLDRATDANGIGAAK